MLLYDEKRNIKIIHYIPGQGNEYFIIQNKKKILFLSYIYFLCISLIGNNSDFFFVYSL